VSLSSVQFLVAPVTASNTPTGGRRVMAVTAWHSLLWLVIANAVGVLIALLLLVPGVSSALGEWTYGRWMPVHLDLQLYGWCSLPLLAFLFEVYGCRRGQAARWVSPVLWLWSAALGTGAISWLSGQSSGKLFLDWTGYVRVLFPIAMLCLWALLAASMYAQRHTKSAFKAIRVVKLAGLAFLLAVPFLLYVASDPSIYPPINPATGGPTGASQLESTLIIIAVLLLLPFGIAHRDSTRRNILNVTWLTFVAECVLCLGLGRADVSHHKPTQWVSLGSLLVWLPLMPMYYNQFNWHTNTRMWRIAFLGWWCVLVPTGWMLFLPGVLDHFKFTDGLVGHSLLAMAGFVSSLLIFVLVQLMKEDGWIFTRSRSFFVWQVSVAAYVAIMFYAGWREGANPEFALAPSTTRNVLYGVRLVLGLLLFAASLDWFRDAFTLFRELNEMDAASLTPAAGAGR
jgi:cytochrome c oxidase cbb3-type subunit 1